MHSFFPLRKTWLSSFPALGGELWPQDLEGRGRG